MEPREGRSAKNDQSLNVSSPLDVFEFNEEDELKSHNKNKEIKKRIFHSACELNISQWLSICTSYFLVSVALEQWNCLSQIILLL